MAGILERFHKVDRDQVAESRIDPRSMLAHTKSTISILFEYALGETNKFYKISKQ